MPSVKNVEKALDATNADPEAKELILTFGTRKVQRGEYFPRAEVQPLPTLSWSKAEPGKTYLLLSLDIDAPFPSLPILGPVLHGIVPGFKKASDSPVLTTDVTPVAAHIGPAPPPLSGPHRYVFLLYEQPSGFDAKKFMPQKEGEEFPMMKRVRFDPDNFVKEAGLAEVLAAGWFLSN